MQRYLFVASACLLVFLRPALAQDSTEPRQLTSGIAVGYPEWSPDGKLIVCSTFGSPEEEEEGNLFLVDPADGSYTQLGQGGTHHGVFAPDGKLVALDALMGTVVQVMPAAGGTQVRVVPESVPVEMSANPLWAPDGRRLAFRSGDSICLLDLPTGEITTAITREGFVPMPVDWLPGTEQLIVLLVKPGELARNLWLLHLDGGVDVQLTDGLYIGQASLSPDGSLLAYAASTDGAAIHLYVMPSGGGPSVQLTFGEVKDFEPDWSPDGRQLVFSSTRAGMPSLWLLDVDPQALADELAAPGA